jgi:LacI family transcriptional regulator
MAASAAARRRRRARPDRGPTLRDVALQAAVSTATVSRALSRPELVSEAVRGRVMAALEALAYVPNAAARALSGRPARLIGVVAVALDDLPAALCLDALARELAANDAAVVLGMSDGGEAATRVCVRQLLARGAEAIAYIGGVVPGAPVPSPPRPSMIWGSYDDAQSGSAPAASGFDGASAWALVAEYLRRLGHRQACGVGLGGAARVDAVRNAVAGSGVELLDNISGGDGLGDRLRGAIERWLALPQSPSAILCGSDPVALAVIEACAARQIEVPGRLSVIGYGDTPVARLARPALSSLRVPAREAGRALARSLVAALEQRTEPRPVWSAKLVLRGSTGPRCG